MDGTQDLRLCCKLMHDNKVGMYSLEELQLIVEEKFTPSQTIWTVMLYLKYLDKGPSPFR